MASRKYPLFPPSHTPPLLSLPHIPRFPISLALNTTSVPSSPPFLPPPSSPASLEPTRKRRKRGSRRTNGYTPLNVVAEIQSSLKSPVAPFTALIGTAVRDFVYGRWTGAAPAESHNFTSLSACPEPPVHSYFYLAPRPVLTRLSLQNPSEAASSGANPCLTGSQSLLLTIPSRPSTTAARPILPQLPPTRLPCHPPRRRR